MLQRSFHYRIVIPFFVGANTRNLLGEMLCFSNLSADLILSITRGSTFLNSDGVDLLLAWVVTRARKRFLLIMLDSFEIKYSFAFLKDAISRWTHLQPIFLRSMLPRGWNPRFLLDRHINKVYFLMLRPLVDDTLIHVINFGCAVAFNAIWVKLSQLTSGELVDWHF